MKYEDFWSIYFTIWGILLIFYLTHSCICLLNYHHLYYLSETVSLLPMFHLLFRWIIVEASDEFGYRVWFLVYRVWCFHPVELAVYQHPASVSILPDCFISILVSSLLVVVHPVVHSRYWLFITVIGLLSWYPVGRSPSLVDHCDRDSYRDSVSRFLDGGFSRIISASRRIWNLMMVDVASLVIYRCGYYPDFSW